MSAKKKKKKKNRGAGALLAVLLVIVAAVVGVVIWQTRSAGRDNATTAIVKASSPLGNSYSGTLVIARNETLVETENMTRIDFVASEGSKVSKSGIICKVYSSGYNQTEINRLQSYREEIQAYHTSQVLNTYVDAELESDNEEIAALAQQVRTLVQGKGVGSLSNLEKQLSSALTVRKNYLRQKYPDDQTLAELYKMENDQLKKIESWTTTHTALRDCLVSFYTDGYESEINSETYSKLELSRVKGIIRGIASEQTTVSRGSDPIFRTVVQDEWYALFLCSDRDWNPIVGEVYRMQLDGFDNYIVSATVESFTRVGNDLLLRMRVNESVEPVLNIRTCGATVGDFVSGLEVPIRALYALDNMIGVVVLDGGVQTYVPVTVVSYVDEYTAFVRPTINGSPLEAGKTIMLY